MPMAGSNSTQTVNASSNSGNATTPGTGAGGGAGANLSTPTSGAQPAPTVGSGKTWELSDYELNRTPQEAVTDGSEIAVSPRALHSELMCPICLDMLHNTMTTKECLHRFCAECIITALRSGNKECPTCRKKLVSKRSLRHDPNFDQLISKIYPSRDEYEAQQQKAMARLSKSHNQLALASSIEEGMKAQSQYRKPKQPTSGKGGAQSSQGGNNNGDSSLVNNNNADDEGAGGQNQTMLNINAIVESVASTTNATTINGGGPNQAQSLLSNTSQVQQPHNAAHQLQNSSGPSGVNANSAALMAAGGLATMSNPSHAGPSPAKISRTDSVGDSSNTSGYSEEVTEVELVFKPHPDMITSNSASAIATAQNQTRFIKTTANASVEHLAKYLGMRLALDSQADGAASTSTLHNCTIYVTPSVGASFITIPQNQTLAQVCEKYWRVNKPLEMYYSWKRL